MSSRPGKSLPDGQAEPCSCPVWLGLDVMEFFAWRWVQHLAEHQMSIRMNNLGKHPNVDWCQIFAKFIYLWFELQCS